METGVSDVLILHADYDANNVAKGDYKILGHGKTFLVILQPGGILKRAIVAAPRRQQTIWICHIELWIGFTGLISTIASDMRSKRQDIIDHLDKYPTLNGVSNCINAFITGADEPIETIGDPRRWWMQRIHMQIEERSTITIA